MIDWIKSARASPLSCAAIFATMVAWCKSRPAAGRVLSPELAAIHAQIEALEQFNRDTRLLVLDQAWWRANPLGMLRSWMRRSWCRVSGNGHPPTTAQRQMVLVAGGSVGRRHEAPIGCCRPSVSDQGGGDEGDAGVQGISSAVVDVTPGNYFELIARQASGSTKNVAADELTWFAIEMVE